MNSAIRIIIFNQKSEWELFKFKSIHHIKLSNYLIEEFKYLLLQNIETQIGLEQGMGD